MSEIVPYQERSLMSYDEVERAARAMAGSKFFSDAADASKAIVKILAAREIGLGPFAGMTGVNIINGKPAFGANIMAACVKKSGRYNYRVTEMSEKNCSIEFMEKLDGKWTACGVSSFSIEDARKAQTKNLDKFPRNMLFARAMSNGVRWFCPDVMNGSVVYTPEELGADVDQDGNVVTVTVEKPGILTQAAAPTEAAETITDGEVSVEITQEKQVVDEGPLTIEAACNVETSDNPARRYGDLSMAELTARFNETSKQLKANHLEPAERAIKERKLKAAKMIIDAKRNGEF
jgi:hypothetical protein